MRIMNIFYFSQIFMSQNRTKMSTYIYSRLYSSLLKYTYKKRLVSAETWNGSALVDCRRQSTIIALLKY